MHPGPIVFVVANSRAARFFLRPYWKEPLRELTDLADSADFINSHRTLTSIRASRSSATAESSVKNDEIESAFLHRVAESVNKAVATFEAQSLVICAPPPELCLIRDYISAPSRSKLSCEITADLVAANVSAIEAEMRHIKA